MGKAMTLYFNLIFYETMKAERLDNSEIILLGFYYYFIHFEIVRTQTLQSFNWFFDCLFKRISNVALNVFFYRL